MADTRQVQASEAGYTISAKLPDNQYDNSVSYFDLLMNPGKKQKLTITIENLVNSNKTFKISPNTAYTANGVNEAYDKYNVDKYSNAKYKFKDIFSGQKEVTLKPYESKDVSLELTMPEEKIVGILEGAIYVIDVDKGETKLTNEESFGIRNQFSMSLGVVLRESSTVHEKPDLKLRQVRASKHNFTNSSAIITTLENNKAATIGKLDIKAKVSRKGSSKTLFNSSIKNRSVAPNSKFDYAVPMYNSWVNPGKYHLHLVADNGVSQWSFDREFDITFAQSMEINKDNKSLWWIWLVILLVIIFVITLAVTYYLGYRHRKNQDLKD